MQAWSWFIFIFQKCVQRINMECKWLRRLEHEHSAQGRICSTPLSVKKKPYLVPTGWLMYAIALVFFRLIQIGWPFSRMIQHYIAKLLKSPICLLGDEILPMTKFPAPKRCPGLPCNPKGWGLSWGCSIKMEDITSLTSEPDSWATKLGSGTTWFSLSTTLVFLSHDGHTIVLQLPGVELGKRNCHKGSYNQAEDFHAKAKNDTT